ncbi:TCF3 fusion partner like protein [Myotis davidii]|uniref:TCF3 fusion partner like protein n=1 Tax=Myotis davidii TaxID=225400 RepID=L5M833_MYODS|nr:TCF3 fusion partner like protein [Myotis davidii]
MKSDGASRFVLEEGCKVGSSARSQGEMKLEQREGSMAAVGFEEFSAPPCSELALPPLFGGHILESKLETDVEFVSGGLGSSSLQEQDEEEEAAQGQQPQCQGEVPGKPQV